MMSWHDEYARNLQWSPAPPPPRLAPLVSGFVLGVLAMTITPLIYLWFAVPIIPGFFAVVFVLAGINHNEVRHVGEGFLAATLCGVLFVVVSYTGLLISS